MIYLEQNAGDDYQCQSTESSCAVRHLYEVETLAVKLENPYPSGWGVCQKVFKDTHDDAMRRLRKLYIFRYGHIPSEVSAMVTRKDGIIVSGNF